MRVEVFVDVFVLVFAAEEAERFLGFAAPASVVAGGDVGVMSVAGAMAEVVVLDVPVVLGWRPLAPHPLRVGASRNASATVPAQRVTRLAAHRSG